MLYRFIKPILFALDPEDAHHLIIHLAKLSPWAGRLSGINPDPRLSLNVGKVDWTFPVGLAAGLDKNAEALSFLSGQGFGAIECGTVTLMPQGGNPRPRIFRYPEKHSLRNAMGFPNEGLLIIYERLKSYEGLSPIGVNLGKNKESSPEESINELALMLETLSDVAKYFVINVSSPNTPGLRALQEKSYLSELFTTLNQANRGKDLYLKISPDLSREKIIELTHLASEFKLTGIIATNTTIMPDLGTGGVSGTLLQTRAFEVQKIIFDENPKLEVIAVGGISEPKDLFKLWSMGGKAVQVYTSYVYQGPELLRKFQKEILQFLDKEKIPSLESFFALTLEDRRKVLSPHIQSA